MKFVKEHLQKNSEKKYKKKQKGSYYKRIIMVLAVFVVCVVIPFTGILFKASEDNVLDRINESNEQVLQQMKYNFDYISNDMTSLCLAVFSQNDVGEIMYSSEPQYRDIYSTIKYLEDSVMQAQSSIQSVAIYNANTENWYVTDTNEGTVNELKSFLQSRDNIPKLKPILRKISVGTDLIEAYSYVFSYFMYEYSDPTTGEGSFIVVNQTVDIFLDNLDAGIGKDSATYIANKSGILYGGTGEAKEAESELAQMCADKHQKEGKEGFYVQKYQGEKYLVSYINLGDDANMIVMVQNYQEIFKGMVELRNEFIILCIIYVLIAGVAVVLLARSIYNPVNELVDYVSQVPWQDDTDEISDDMDEIGRLRTIFQKANVLNQKLRDERNNSQKIIENYWLRGLLNDSSQERLDEFRRNMPGSVLEGGKAHPVGILRIHLDTYEENRFSFAQEDRELLIDSARNVMQEMLEPDFESQAVNEPDKDVVLIIIGKHKDSSGQTLLSYVRDMQKFMAEHFDVTLSVAYEWGAADLSEISQIYEKVNVYAKYRAVYGKGSLLGWEECRNNIENQEVTYPRELRKKLEESLKLGDKTQAYEVLNAIRDSISKLSYDNIIINSMSLITRINTVLSEMNMMKKHSMVLPFDQIYKAALNMEFIDELFKEVEQYIDSVLEDTYQHTEKENDKDEIFVEMVVEFVRENYMDSNLSSQSIADYTNMSSRYVLKKFKKCAGITLNEYILTVRMKQAAYFLTNSDMPVSQIAENIGICNENYFYRLFKKVYGCTPREFATGHRENEAAETE